MSDPYIDGVFDGIKSIRKVREEMLMLAMSFTTTGNTAVATKMQIWCEDLETHTGQIQQAVTGELTRKTGKLAVNNIETETETEPNQLGDIFCLGGGNGR